MKRIIHTIVFCLLINLSSAQNYFYKKYSDSVNTQYGASIIKLVNNNFLISGRLQSAALGKGFGYLLEVDSNGNLINETKLTDTFNNYITLRSTQQINLKYYTVGNIIPNDLFSEDNNMYIRCTNINGSNIWYKNITNNIEQDYAYKVINDNNKLSILGIKNEDEKHSRVNLMQLDTNGGFILNKDIIDSSYDYIAAYDFVKTIDTNYIIIGYRDNAGQLASGRTFIYKTNAQFDTIFSRNILTNDYYYFRKIYNTLDSKIISIGSFEGVNTSEASVVKFDYFGVPIWSINLSCSNGINPEMGTCLKQESDSSYIIGGINNYGILIYKVDKDGVLLWQKDLSKIIDGDIVDIFRSGNGYLIFGNSIDRNFVRYNFVAKLDSLGNFQYATNINPITKEQESIKVYPNPSNSIINIQTMHPEKIKEIQLYNLQGTLIKTYPKSVNSIDLSSYANGNYFLKVQYATSSNMVQIIKK